MMPDSIRFMKRRNSSISRSTATGFTLIEVMVVVILMGVLFAIAAPNWVAFINQQRVGSARNQVSQAIRSAQTQAQQTKINRAVVFDNNGGRPRYAIVPAPNNVVPSTITNWQTLGDGTIAPGMIRLSANQPAPTTLIFDSFGSVASLSSFPYTITIGAAAGTNPRRCVLVNTLLGAISEGSNSECN